MPGHTPTDCMRRGCGRGSREGQETKVAVPALSREMDTLPKAGGQAGLLSTLQTLCLNQGSSEGPARACALAWA